ncbi:MAG TPA: hypothetical protein PK295_04010 [Candidatus Magasanikbacteria bacterium]|nr:hypothetical protein [Candidatus Magasanikbacteria bacterium]
MSRVLTDILRAENNPSFRREMKRLEKAVKNRIYHGSVMLAMVFVAFCSAALSDVVEESEEDEPSSPTLH